MKKERIMEHSEEDKSDAKLMFEAALRLAYKGKQAGPKEEAYFWRVGDSDMAVTVGDNTNEKE